MKQARMVAFKPDIQHENFLEERKDKFGISYTATIKKALEVYEQYTKKQELVV